MGIEQVLNIVATLVFFTASVVLWRKGRIFSAAIVGTAVTCASTFGWVASYYPVEFNPESGFPLWFRVLGMSSVAAFVAISTVLLVIARQLPAAAPNKSFKRTPDGAA